MVFLLELVLVVVLVAAAVTLYTYSFFWYENSGTERGDSKSSREAVFKLMLHGMVSGFVCLLIIFFTYPIGFIPSFRRPKEVDPSRPLIVLVHGIYHNASGWLLLRHRLMKAGYLNIFSMNYLSFFTSFDSISARLEKFIAKTRAEAPGQPLILIGHSMGGLLCRVFAEHSSGDDVPEAVITLGTPHRGSKVAAFALGGLGRSLIYEGRLFKDLQSEGRRLPCRGIILTSPADGMVLPADSLKAPYPGWTEYETEPVSHIAMLYCEGIAGLVTELIKQ